MKFWESGNQATNQCSTREFLSPSYPLLAFIQSLTIQLWILYLMYLNVSVHSYSCILKNICARWYTFVSRLLAVVDWGLCCTLDITLGWHDSQSLVNNRKVGRNNNQLSNVFGSKTDRNSFCFGTRTSLILSFLASSYLQSAVILIYLLLELVRNKSLKVI